MQISGYGYDAIGNMTAGNALAITHAALNKPATIACGSSQIGFAHDPEHQRFKQTAAAR